MQFSFIDALQGILSSSGFAALAQDPRSLIMILVSFVLLYLGIGKKFEPLLLVPIAFGILLANFPLTGMLNAPADGASPGMLWVFYQGVEHAIYPSIIFLGIGAMTDFGPLIARPSSLLLGAAAQLGIFSAFLLALVLGFPGAVAAAIGIIGGADGPTAILVASRLASDYLPAIAIAAYSYMALIPLIQPPLMRLLTTKKEREVKMEQLRPVSKTEKIVFPIAVATIVILLILRLGQIMNVGYEKTILMYSPATYETADVIASYVYRVGVKDSDYGYSTAINFFNSIVNLLVLFVANSISRKLSDSSLW